MKLHEALRQAVRQFGMNVLQERRLVFILSDLRAFGEFPAMRKVMEAIVSGGSGKELCRIGLSGSADEYRSFAAGLEKTLAGSGFSGEFAHYALGCVSYALGFASSVSEPSDHGFDPRGSGSAGGQAEPDAMKMPSGSTGSAGFSAGVRKKETAGSAGSAQSSGTAGVSPAPAGSSVAGGTGPGAALNQIRKKSGKGWILIVLAVLAVCAFAAVRLGPDMLRRYAAAYSGDPVAQEELGSAYAHAVIPDMDAAEKWWRKAAEQGNSDAMTALGDMYHLAYSTELSYAEDAREAFKWYKKAADLGNPYGVESLGDLYSSGWGVPENKAYAGELYRKALEQYRAAAGEGDARAQYLLGRMYHVGHGVSTDYPEAAKWYRMAAEQGNGDAELAIAYMYKQGKGVEKNYAEARRWFSRAAERDDSIGSCARHELKDLP